MMSTMSERESTSAENHFREEFTQAVYVYKRWIGRIRRAVTHSDMQAVYKILIKIITSWNLIAK